MAGLTGHVQAELEAHVMQGEALSAAAQAHLGDCSECREHLEFLQQLQLTLLEEMPPVAPPALLREQVLTAARKTPIAAPPLVAAAPPYRRIWWPFALGAAAVITGLLVWGSVLLPSRSSAAVLPDPAVVVSTTDGLLVASNDRAGTLSVVQGGQVRGTLTTSGREKPWFTQGVRLGERVYLSDAANNRVLEVSLKPLSIVKTYAVPDGVAGLTATTGPEGGRVYFKSVRGAVGVLDGQQITIAQEPGMPLADVMDGVLLQGGKLWVTHHVKGTISTLDAVTLKLLNTYQVGGAPVEIAAYKGGLLALDVTGRLLHLNLQGKVMEEWKLPGHPDKLGLNGDMVLVTDRSGQVTSIELPSGTLKPMPLTHPMDVTPLPDGTFAVAEGGHGVRVVDAYLNTEMTLEHGQK